MLERVYMETNLARKPRLFHSPPHIRQISTTYPVEYLAKDTIVHIPADILESVSDMPQTRLALAALITIWLTQDRKTYFIEDKPYGVVKTTLNEMCRTIGVNISGKNKKSVKNGLCLLNKVVYKNITFYQHNTTDKTTTKKIEEICVLAPYMKIITRNTVKQNENTITVHICPPVTQALLGPGPIKAHIPIRALKELQKHPKLSVYGQNVLFYLAGSRPANDSPLRRKIETMLEVANFSDTRRDKNTDKFNRILDALQRADYIRWTYDQDKGMYIINYM